MKLFYTINNLISGNEGFTNSNDDSKRNSLLITWFVSFVIYIVLILFVGRWVWNNVLVRLVSGVNKIKNPVDLIWLHLLFSLLFGTL
jgi:hypothetical protein